jgi:hypothetical protein
MAFTRPAFPVIQYIVGLDEWRNRPKALHSLPSGIRIQGSTITIELSRAVEHPLFRFCLELFSIVPKTAVDLESNKLKSTQPSSSGYYQFVSKSDRNWLFRKRDCFAQIHGKNPPIEILFQFVPAAEVMTIVRNLDEKTVIASNEGLFSSQDLIEIERTSEMRAAPSSRFGAILLNPNFPPFDRKECRQYFIGKFRKLLGQGEFQRFQIEASLFTKLLPGYLKTEELAKHISPHASCRSALQSSNLKWASVKGMTNFLYDTTVIRALDDLGGVSKNHIQLNSKAEMTDWFHENKLAIIPVATGFWPLDPVGDLQMLFTPNLHKVLKFVSRDQVLQEFIKKILNEKDAKQRTVLFEALNRYLFEDALFNVYIHFRRFFITHKSRTLRNIPLAITSSAPWQLFETN